MQEFIFGKPKSKFITGNYPIFSQSEFIAGNDPLFRDFCSEQSSVSVIKAGMERKRIADEGEAFRSRISSWCLMVQKSNFSVPSKTDKNLENDKSQCQCRFSITHI